jgi:hypothetical protein
MRVLSISFALFFCLFFGAGNAQGQTLSALYNPADGSFFFNGIADLDLGGLVRLDLQSSGPALLGANMIDLAVYPGIGDGDPFAKSASHVRWTVFSIQPTLVAEPTFAGFVVEPGTDIETLSFSYDINATFSYVAGQIIQIPEPSTAAMLFACSIIPAIARRRR